MRETKSVIFLPDNVKYVSVIEGSSSTSAIGYQPISDQIKRNPYQRETIRRQAKKRGEYLSSIPNVPTHSQSNLMQNNVSQFSKISNKNYSGKKEIIKNLTDGPIYMRFSTRMEGKNPIDEFVDVVDYKHIGSLTESQINSSQFQQMLIGGKIDVITVEQMKDEIKIRQSVPSQRQPSGKRVGRLDGSAISREDILDRVLNDDPNADIERIQIGGSGGGMSDLIREIETAGDGPIKQSDFNHF